MVWVSVQRAPKAEEKFYGKTAEKKLASGLVFGCQSLRHIHAYIQQRISVACVYLLRLFEQNAGHSIRDTELLVSDNKQYVCGRSLSLVVLLFCSCYWLIRGFCFSL